MIYFIISRYEIAFSLIMSVNAKLIPSYLFDSYSDIIKCDLIANKILSDESVMEFQQLLNMAIPESEADTNYKEIIKFLYRKNPRDFYKLLISSRLKNIILWTESKCIVSHFGLRNIVYIKWDKDENIYKCNIHNNIKNDPNGFNDNLLNGIGLSTFLQNTNKYGSGYRGRYPDRNNRGERFHRDDKQSYHRSDGYHGRNTGGDMGMLRDRKYTREHHYYNTSRNNEHRERNDLYNRDNWNNRDNRDDELDKSRSDPNDILTPNKYSNLETEEHTDVDDTDERESPPYLDDKHGD